MLPRLVSLLPFLAATVVLRAGDATEPGAVSTPFPTLNHLAVEWEITGDDDLDCICAVKFRPRGEKSWQPAMPLRRVAAGASRGTQPVFTWSNRMSGSIFDLPPGTTYEIALELRDPDGGSAEKIIEATTRAEPVATANAPVRRGSKADVNGVRPGEVLLLEDGDYGAVTFNRDGEPGKPIVFRSETGRAVFSEIGLSGRKWVFLEGVTVNGPIRMPGTEHCVVRRCTIRAQYGIKAYRPGMMNACIEDNVITGIRAWQPELMGANGDNSGEGIQFTGSGNVIRYNRVSGFRDCISHMEDDGAVAQQCNDIVGNDINAGLDDGIEADFALHNCRVIRNRLTNCFVGISSQPGLGGPNYFLRNELFNVVLSAFKLHRFSRGDVILHNTVVKAGDGFGNHTSEPFEDALIQNNLFIGGKPPGEANFGGYSCGRGRAVDVQQFGPRCVFDYNAYGTHGLPFEGKIGSRTFTRLPGESFEAHGMKATLEMLERPIFPADPAREMPAADLRLRADAPLVDAALRIPNINDAFIGSGPDIGALEHGAPAPHYGPRPAK